MRHPLRLFLITSLALPPALYSQPSWVAGMGIKAGAQWSTLLTSDVTYLGIPGGLAGLYFPMLASTRLEFQPELLLSYQGADLQRTDKDPARFRMLYMHLPVSAKLYFTNDLNLQGGLLAGKSITATLEDERITDEIRPYDVGFVAGIGLDLRSGFDLTARYYGGTTPVLVETTGVNPRHRVVQLTAGYRVMRFGHRRHKLHKG